MYLDAAPSVEIVIMRSRHFVFFLFNISISLAVSCTPHNNINNMYLLYRSSSLSIIRTRRASTGYYYRRRRRNNNNVYNIFLHRNLSYVTSARGPTKNRSVARLFVFSFPVHSRDDYDEDSFSMGVYNPSYNIIIIHLIKLFLYTYARTLNRINIRCRRRPSNWSITSFKHCRELYYIIIIPRILLLHA